MPDASNAEIVNYADDFVVCGKAPAAYDEGRCRGHDGAPAATDQRDEDPQHASA